MGISFMNKVISTCLAGIFGLLAVNTCMAINSSINNLYYFGGSFTSANSDIGNANIWSGLLSTRYDRPFDWQKYIYAHGGGGSDNLRPQLLSGVNLGIIIYNSYIQNVSDGANTLTHNDIFLTYTGPNDFSADEYANALLNDHTEAYANSIGFSLINYVAAFGGGVIPGFTGIPGTIPYGDLGPNVETFLDRRITLINNHVTELKNRGSVNHVIFTHFDEADRDRARLIANVAHGELSGIRAPDGEFLVTKHITEWNKRLVESMKTIDTNIVIIDYGKLVNEVVTAQHDPNDPNSDISKSYIPNDVANRGRIGVWDPNNAQNFGAFFPSYTGFHPGPAAHEITANYVASVLEAVDLVAEVTTLAIASGRTYIEQVFSHRQKRIAENKTFNIAVLGSNTFDSTVSAKNASIGYKNKPAFNGAVRLDYNHNNMLGIGVAIGRYSQEMNMSDVISAKHEEYAFSLLPEVRINNPMLQNSSVVIQGLFGFGMSKYNIERQIPMGLITRGERGKTRNNRFISGLRSTMPIKFGTIFTLKPYVEGIYQNTGRLSYTEVPYVDDNGNEVTRSTRMQFNAKNRHSLDLGGGVTLISNFNLPHGFTIFPYVEINAKYGFLNEIKNTERKAQLSDIAHEFHAFGVFSRYVPSKVMTAVKLGTTVQKGIFSTSLNYEIAKPRSNKIAHQIFFDITAAFG
jgi:hypothetical protein